MYSTGALCFIELVKREAGGNSTDSENSTWSDRTLDWYARRLGVPEAEIQGYLALPELEYRIWDYTGGRDYFIRPRLFPEKEEVKHYLSLMMQIYTSEWRRHHQYAAAMWDRAVAKRKDHHYALRARLATTERDMPPHKLARLRDRVISLSEVIPRTEHWRREWEVAACEDGLYPSVEEHLLTLLSDWGKENAPFTIRAVLENRTAFMKLVDKTTCGQVAERCEAPSQIQWPHLPTVVRYRHLGPEIATAVRLQMVDELSSTAPSASFDQRVSYA